MGVGGKPLQGAGAPLPAAPTMSLCDCVAPYADIPLEGAAGWGVSGWMYPLLSMRLQERTTEQDSEEKAKDAINTVSTSILGVPLSAMGPHLRHLRQSGTTFCDFCPSKFP